MTIRETPPQLFFDQLDLTIDDVQVCLATMRSTAREPNTPPILFLHGFGSTKEDYADAIHHRDLQHHSILAYDAPGTGDTYCSALTKITIPFLVKTARKFLLSLNVETFFIAGHSMGGLTALQLANEERDRVLGFVNIEGNVSPEDCFLSRQVILYANPDPKAFFQDFIDRARYSTQRSSALYAASLRFKVRPEAVRSIFESMVELSDKTDLMSMFLGLPCPRMFMFGEQNASLSYLVRLAGEGVKLSSISSSGHWPMYSNPTAMWNDIASFHKSIVAGHP